MLPLFFRRSLPTGSFRQSGSLVASGTRAKLDSGTDGSCTCLEPFDGLYPIAILLSEICLQLLFCCHLLQVWLMGQFFTTRQPPHDHTETVTKPVKHLPQGMLSPYCFVKQSRS